MEDSALWTKIICLVLFGVISLACGLVPLVASRAARRWRRSRAGKTEVRVKERLRLVLSCVLCLGGGVLLGTVFTHMLPEIREIFEEIESADLLPGMHSPAGEIFICVGFFLVYLVEELVHACLAGRASAKKRRDVAPAPVVSSPSAVVVEVHGDRDAMSWHEKYAEPPPVTAAVTEAAAELSEHGHHHGGAAGHDHGAVVATLHALRAYIVIVALSVHSVFEGFAVAFETTSRDVWVLFAAIATHKAIVAFCLGEQLLATKRSACFVVTNMLILSAASPLGVTVGLAVEQLDQDEGSRLLATGLLQALAAGTILYVVFFEILAPERQKHGAGLFKFLAVVAGFSLIVLMHSSGAGHSHGGHGQTLLAGGHGHGHGGHSEAHGHEHGGHEHEHDHRATESVNSDYLLRVPNESGHVYNTVRYIKSFNRQEPPTVTAGDIVAGMRSIVEDLGIDHDHGELDDEHHGAVGGETSEDSPGGKDSGRRKAKPQHDDHTDGHGDHEEHDHDEHDHHDHEEHDHETSGSGSSGSHSASEEAGDAHHHDHDQFMRTVADLAGHLAGLDRRAVDRTVTLIDTLDLIAMQKTDRKGKSRAKGAGSSSGVGRNHDHEQEHDHDHDNGHEHEHDHDHDHDHGSVEGGQLSPSSTAPSARSMAKGGDPNRDESGRVEPGQDESRRWLHAAHFGEPIDGHVQFVLQEPVTQPDPARDSESAATTSSNTGTSEAGEHQQELDARRELDALEEVRFHSRARE
ncbi:uncharacterized protein LOC122388316 [Amphibalanus amphitrite]|uniref:uncharacterized protein LOC122388316 n=1 Tax=Amphibalanus amphitrite TaxID=1232801 RepID=UPI001C910554|nr:uncharacterized protein LOC122388316 [Amphibalanus amphitrite]